jgi:hypothetical protein
VTVRWATGGQPGRRARHIFFYEVADEHRLRDMKRREITGVRNGTVTAVRELTAR